MHARKIEIHVTVLMVFAATLSMYLLCAAPSVMYGDSAELQTVALMGGIAHPPGYPTFILFGRVFGTVLGGDQAHRITAMSSFFGAAAACALIAVLLKFGLPLGIATLGALIYALSFTFFWCSIRAEVYTIAIFLFLISIWLTIHALERPSGAKAALAGAIMGLVLTAHLAFAPAIIVMLFALILSRSPRGVSQPKYALAIVVAFVAGFLPYLYFFWVDRGSYPMNYLNYTIETGGRQYGLTKHAFNDPWKRLLWLVLGNETRPMVFILHFRPMMWQMLRVLVVEFVYHYGPVAFPLFFIGFYQAIRKLRRRATLLIGIMAASFLFGAGFGEGRLLSIFILPLTICLAITISFGIWYLFEKITGQDSPISEKVADGGHHMRWVWYPALVVLVCSIVVVPHVARVHLQDSPTFPEDLKLHVEGEPTIDTVVPSLRDFWEPRRYGERILDLVPENALVVGKWKEIMALYYLHYVEGKRPDITLEPYDFAHYVRLNRWQKQHDLSTHPIVFLRHPSELKVNIDGFDTLAVYGEQYIYTRRDPFEPLLPSLRPSPQ